MDKKLSMNKHFEELFSRVQKRIPLLKLIAGVYNRPKVQPETTIAVYRTMIRPLMEYEPTSLMLLKPHHLEKLERQQFKALKIAHHLPNYTSSRYIQEEHTKMGNPTSRIQHLAQRYIKHQTPASTLFNTIQHTMDSIQRNKFGPLTKTLIG
jgi:hypothetical protein